MLTHSINIGDILIDDSRFSLSHYIFDAVSDRSCQINSFDTLGILYPIIVYEDNNKRLHLIDGKKRAIFALQSGDSNIRATVLPGTTPVTDLLILILCNKRHEIASSAINRIQFIYFANSLNAAESWILQSLCIPFEFKPHRDFFRECERIYNLPRELKLFCHEKKLSLKQMLNLSYHPQDLLTELLKWKSSIQLTASILDEIASNLKDYFKRENRSISDFIGDHDVREIFDSSLSPRDKTDKLRQIIRIKRFPVLSETNARMMKTIEDLNLPKGIRVNWDCTLENKNVNLTLNIHNPDQWQNLLMSLQSEEVKEALKSVLDEL
jgi:hypothetical protein